MLLFVRPPPTANTWKTESQSNRATRPPSRFLLRWRSCLYRRVNSSLSWNHLHSFHPLMCLFLSSLIMARWTPGYSGSGYCPNLWWLRPLPMVRVDELSKGMSGSDDHSGVAARAVSQHCRRCSDLGAHLSWINTCSASCRPVRERWLKSWNKRVVIVVPWNRRVAVVAAAATAMRATLEKEMGWGWGVWLHWDSVFHMSAIGGGLTRRSVRLGSYMIIFLTMLSLTNFAKHQNQYL